ncbi:hypothetical protein TWF281_003117 [Arthrobotrys megalospora]
MLSTIGLILLISGYSSAFYIKVKIDHPDSETHVGPYFLCWSESPPSELNRKTLFAIDPMTTFCENEGGKPDFLVRKPGANELDFYDELKRDKKVPYDPATFYISGTEPWGTNFNLPIIVGELDKDTPLALSTHIWDPMFPVSFKAKRGRSVQKDITEENPPKEGDLLEFVGHPTLVPKDERDLRIKLGMESPRYPILRGEPTWNTFPVTLSVSSDQHMIYIQNRREGQYLKIMERKAAEDKKANAKGFFGGFFGGIKNQITSGATNIKDKVGAGLSKIKPSRRKEEEETKENYPEPEPEPVDDDPALRGGEWDEKFDIYQDVDPEHMKVVEEPAFLETETDLEEKIPVDALPGDMGSPTDQNAS